VNLSFRKSLALLAAGCCAFSAGAQSVDALAKFKSSGSITMGVRESSGVL